MQCTMSDFLAISKLHGPTHPFKTSTVHEHFAASAINSKMPTGVGFKLTTNTLSCL